jgi:hypothetical protein
LGRRLRRNYSGAASMMAQAAPETEGADVPFFDLYFSDDGWYD